MYKHQLIALLTTCAIAFSSAVTASSFLPDDETFLDSVPTPESQLGWPVGQWHARPEQIEQYFEQLAASSPRASLEVIGKSHEQRNLVHLRITSADNQQQLESLRQQHLDGDGPLVVWLGYSIHGNEASGSNAAMLVAYQLLASQAQWVQELLEDTVVIIDPMFNPDGLGRFATWANMHRGQQTAGHLLHRSRWEAWPAGRFNHYWFDMNRDWLPATQPESVARLQQFHRWLPNVLGDFHEQGSNAGYFFQPGVPLRKNPLTPDENVELTTELARYHAAALDKIGQRYYSRETFDDFYYGKGSTYPDINGSIGILYEQPSTRGHKVDSVNGTFTFTDAVRNHYATSISTLQGAHAIKGKLHDYQQRFYVESAKRANRSDTRAWIVGDDGDPQRTATLLELLRLHQIDVFPLDEDIRHDGHRFTPGHAWVVPARQRQSALIEAMFEQRTEFTDNTFYDVSAWTLPHAFNLPFAKLDKLPDYSTEATPKLNAGSFTPANNASAYRISHQGVAGAAAVMQLLNDEVRVYRIGSGNLDYTDGSPAQPGDYIVPVLRDVEADQLISQLQQTAQRWQVEIEPISSGFNLAGADLGSPNNRPLKAVHPLLIVGQGVVPMEAGHIWHLLDRRLGMPLPMLDVHHPQMPDLNDFTHLLVPDMQPGAIPAEWYPLIIGWVKRGGTLITQKRSAQWAEAIFSIRPDATDTEITEQQRITRLVEQLSDTKDESFETLGRQPYQQYSVDAADRVLGGAIFSAQLDLSHPLASGFQRDQLPVFLNSITPLQASRNAYSNPMIMQNDKPLAGFSSLFSSTELAEAPLLVVDKTGQGSVIKFAFNPNFRAFWYGTEGLYINALLNSISVQATIFPAD